MELKLAKDTKIRQFHLASDGWLVSLASTHHRNVLTSFPTSFSIPSWKRREAVREYSSNRVVDGSKYIRIHIYVHVYRCKMIADKLHYHQFIRKLSSTHKQPRDLIQQCQSILREFYQNGNKDAILPKSFNLLLNDWMEQSNFSTEVINIRRELHKYPELMYQEKITSSIIETKLKEFSKIDNYSTGWGKNIHPDVFDGPGGYGIVADIEGKGTRYNGQADDNCVLLRADFDALPISEKTEDIDEFKSVHPMRMHACGHDAHSAMLLGAAAVLKQFENILPGNIRLMFQPAEEGGAGAKRMIEEGILQKEPRPKCAFALHVWPT